MYFFVQTPVITFFNQQIALSKIQRKISAGYAVSVIKYLEQVATSSLTLYDLLFSKTFRRQLIQLTRLYYSVKHNN